MRLRVIVRFGRAGRRPAFVVASFAVHVAVTLAFVYAPADAGADRERLEVRSVGLVAAAPARPPATATAPPPAEPTVETPPPKPKPEPEPKPKEATIEDRPVVRTPKPEKPPEPEPEAPPAPPETSTEEVEEAVEGAAPSGRGASIGVASGVAGGDGDLLAGSEHAWYASRVIGQLQRYWERSRPPLAFARDPLSVVVSFEIYRDGEVRNARVESSSGVRALDRSALRAVVDAAPLPPLPRTVTVTPYPARLEFRWEPGEG